MKTAIGAPSLQCQTSNERQTGLAICLADLNARFEPPKGVERQPTPDQWCQSSRRRLAAQPPWACRGPLHVRQIQYGRTYSLLVWSYIASVVAAFAGRRYSFVFFRT